MPYVVTFRSKVSIAEALLEIDSHCDGAKKRDYYGFNKEDAAYYKPILAEHDTEEDFTCVMFDGFAWNAFYKLKKYSEQLADYGICWRSLRPAVEWRA